MVSSLDDPASTPRLLAKSTLGPYRPETVSPNPNRRSCSMVRDVSFCISNRSAVSSSVSCSVVVSRSTVKVSSMRCSARCVRRRVSPIRTFSTCARSVRS